VHGAEALRFSAAAIAVGLISSNIGAASADPVEPSPEGRWFAYAVADGQAAGGNADVDVVWDGNLRAKLQFDVDASGALTRGAWELSGYAYQDVYIGNLYHVVGDLTYTGGGTATGTISALSLDGSARTRGTVDIADGAAGPAASVFPLTVDNTDPLPTLTVRPQRICDELIGGWEYPVNAAFADAGSTELAIKGRFIGVREGNGVSEQAIAEFRELFVILDVPVDESSDTDAFVALRNLMVVAIDQYDELMDSYPAWNGDQVYATVDLMHTIIYELRNLSECRRAFFQEGQIEEFIDGFTGAIQDLTDALLLASYLPGVPQGFATRPDTPIDPITHRLLTEVAVNGGAIGAGAVDHEAADALEDALIELGSKMLTAARARGDRSSPTDDEIRVLTTGAIMGWTYTVDGTEIDAREAMAELANS
jgi:hypothetical protein